MFVSVIVLVQTQTVCPVSMSPGMSLIVLDCTELSLIVLDFTLIMTFLNFFFSELPFGREGNSSLEIKYNKNIFPLESLIR